MEMLKCKETITEAHTHTHTLKQMTRLIKTMVFSYSKEMGVLHQTVVLSFK